jgi:hypothetical protein
MISLLHKLILLYKSHYFLNLFSYNIESHFSPTQVKLYNELDKMAAKNLDLKDIFMAEPKDTTLSD